MSIARRGFVLLAVLWTIIGCAALAFAVAFTAQEMIGAARNRMLLTSALWRAEGCVARARAVIDASFASPGAERPRPAASAILDRLVTTSVLVQTCDGDVTLIPEGTTVDINTVGAEQLDRLFDVLGWPGRDSLVAAVLDWRDGDDQAREGGAERAWYEAHKRALPRNGPFADVDELRLVRGFEETSGLDSVLGVERGRIPLNAAPLPVIRSLPGIGDEILAQLAERRRTESPIEQLLQLTTGLPSAARADFELHYSQLTNLVTINPEAWLLTSRASIPPDGPVITLELRLVRVEKRTMVTRRRIRQ
jgi:type II secretory pathway component PulK